MSASLFPPQSGSGTTSITTSSPLSGAGTIGSPATIANGAIALAKLANLANATVIGRSTAGTGVPEAVTMAQLITLLGGGYAAVTGESQRIWYSAALDIKAVAKTTIIPATAFRLRCTGFGFEIKTTTACTVGPTLSAGSNSANFDNTFASQAVTDFTTQAAETSILLTPITPNVFPDLTTSGFQLNITTGATATTLTARAFVTGWLMPV